MIVHGQETLGTGLLPLGDRGLDAFEDAGRWRRTDTRVIGGDTMSVYRAAGHLGVEGA